MTLLVPSADSSCDGRALRERLMERQVPAFQERRTGESGW